MTSPTTASKSKPGAVLPPHFPPALRRKRKLWRWVVLAFLLLTAGAVWKLDLLPTRAKPVVVESAKPIKHLSNWDGTIRLDAAQQASMGIMMAEVSDQIEPIQLKLLGTTKYDEESLSQIRILFRGRVDRVHVRTGQSVRRGDPLLDIYSTALADAKSDYEIRKIEWEYQDRLARNREELRKQGSISEQLYLETRNEEMRRRREFDIAKDRLLIFGLTDAEIEAVDDQNGTQKARLTLRAPADGIVVERNVVTGNLYDESDTLLVVTPVDHLWVWGNVFESDIDLVRIGQTWEIRFPFLKESVRGQVEFISHQVDPHSRRFGFALRFRTPTGDSGPICSSKEFCKSSRSPAGPWSPDQP